MEQTTATNKEISCLDSYYYNMENLDEDNYESEFDHDEWKDFIRDRTYSKVYEDIIVSYSHEILYEMSDEYDEDNNVFYGDENEHSSLLTIRLDNTHSSLLTVRV